MTAALVAAVVFFVLATLPPNPVAVDVAGADDDLLRRTVAGAYHIHTTRSDGAEDKRAVASAARRAGLQFAIFADHGDGTRMPDPPEYIDGVLCLDGVEISTNGGHYVALDMPAAPYPLGGEAVTVVEDVARLGGFGIAAHPDSLKGELAWTAWNAPIDGIEWLSVDSEWRDEPTSRLARALVDYLFRPGPAIASILDRPAATLARWDALLVDRPVVALASVDAHGGMRNREEGGTPAGIGPSYEASFRTLSNRVLVDRPLTGDAAADARVLMGAIRKGRVYTVVDALATPALFDFGSPSPQWTAPTSGRVQTISVGSSVRYEVLLDSAPGTPPVPWVVTNPVVMPPAPVGPPPAVEPRPGTALAGEWHVEHDPTSTASLKTDDDVSLIYVLGPPPRVNQFAALTLDLRAPAPFTEVLFEASAASPMRVSVQLRLPGGDARWLKSAYLDQNQRAVSVHVRDMVAASKNQGAMPAPAGARSLLFVVDLTNALPGARGSFTIRNLRTASAQSPAAPR